MAATPVISIVVPAFNDAATIAASLRTAVAQTLTDIEVICVDDASTDATAAIVAQLSARDDRIRLLRHERNLTAFQARRTGILAARGDYVLFLDGDDELVPEAAEKAVTHARATDADLVGFGVTVVDRHGRTGGSYERRLQPAHRELEGADVLRGLFPIGKPAQGQLWRYLFRTSILRDAYALLPDDLPLPRVNDLPIMFLAAALAGRFTSISDHLYRYHFGRGGSGHRLDTIERAAFYVSAIDSIDAIREAVDSLQQSTPDATGLAESYQSARLSLIGYVCFQVIEKSDPGVLDRALALLREKVSEEELVHGAARFYPKTLKTLRYHVSRPEPSDRPVRSILVCTSTLRTGGVSAVVVSQARYLQEAGFRVTIAARGGGSDRSMVPDGVAFVELTQRDYVARLQEWGQICRTNAVDVVIDHQVLYTQYWPEFALVARAEGARTIGWLHNFCARPIYDGSDRLSLITGCSGALAQLVVLSPLDVAYFKLRGVGHTSYLPNPPSSLLLESLAHPVRKQPPSGRLELVWWGRLEQHTKQVLELIEVGVQLSRLGVDYRMTVIGPDWDDMTAKRFNAEARRRRVGDRAAAVGPRRGRRLREAIDAADVFVSTSIIEGYQLTIAEAQARGLPVFMYELPWLLLVQGNGGIVSVPQGDARSLAGRLADLVDDPQRYTQLSAESVAAAERARDFDFGKLYRAVVTDALPQEFSPDPTLEDARELLAITTFFAERAAIPDRVRSIAASSLGTRIWQMSAPAGRAVLERIPGLRPLAHRAKKWVGIG